MLSSACKIYLAFHSLILLLWIMYVVPFLVAWKWSSKNANCCQFCAMSGSRNEMSILLHATAFTGYFISPDTLLIAFKTKVVECLFV